jgi:recombination protein RecR
MDFLPASVNNLIEELSKLPGIGAKTAQRLAFHILKDSEHNNKLLGESVSDIKKGVKLCEKCFALTSQSPCRICENPGRDRATLLVIENTVDMLALEKTGEYKGLYHVLHGKISPLDGVGPDDLKIMELFTRLTNPESGIEEIILALNPDLEGDTTSLFIQRKLATFNPLRVSRIARGLPSGGALEYTDDRTLVKALEGRQVLS